MRLYEWNLAVSGVLYEALSILEVVLRNALSTQLAAHHGTLTGHWYDDPLDWIDADVRAWAVSLSRLQPIIATRPN